MKLSLLMLVQKGLTRDQRQRVFRVWWYITRSSLAYHLSLDRLADLILDTWWTLQRWLSTRNHWINLPNIDYQSRDYRVGKGPPGVHYRWRPGIAPRPTRDVLRWAHAFERKHRRVVQTLVKGPGDFVDVSSIFLGLDHNYLADGPPLIFETMVFRGPFRKDVTCVRTPSHGDTLDMHDRLVFRWRFRYLLQAWLLAAGVAGLIGWIYYNVS